MNNNGKKKKITIKIRGNERLVLQLAGTTHKYVEMNQILICDRGIFMQHAIINDSENPLLPYGFYGTLLTMRQRNVSSRNDIRWKFTNKTHKKIIKKKKKTLYKKYSNYAEQHIFLVFIVFPRA